eukprot:7823975-Ditylum_brightwellii.AAC.1
MLMPSVLTSVWISSPKAENEEKTSSGARIFATRFDSNDHEARKDAKRAQEEAEHHKAILTENNDGITKT